MKLGIAGNILNKLVIQSKMEDGIKDLLTGLKVYIEKGFEIKDTKSLQNILKVI